MPENDHPSAERLERRKSNKATRELRDRIWTMVLLVLVAILIITVFAIQINHLLYAISQVLI
jgi:hypothetical protein